MKIRNAAKRDAGAIAQLSSELGYAADTEVMERRIQALVKSPVDILIVAVDTSDRPVAWLQAHSVYVIESGFRVEILGLIVSPATRRTGVGRALVCEAEQWAASLSAESIVVRSNANRVESHAFYPALGYNHSKTQQVYRKVPKKRVE